MDSGAWVALSVSDPPEHHLVARGLSRDHLSLAFVELARHLLAAGYHLAYGGDLRFRGFTDQLFNLVRSYHLPAPGPAKRIRNYLADYLLDAAPAEDRAAARNVAEVHRVELPRTGLQAGAEMTPAVSQALTLSAMRRRVTEETSARIVLGGKIEGGSGRAPGVLEEAWCSVRAGRPLFVLGGFGGVGSLIADRLVRGNTDAQDTLLANDPGYVAMAGALRGALLEGEARTGEEMLAEIASAGIAGLHNGLTEADNLRLFEIDDIDELISLILEGLSAAG